MVRTRTTNRGSTGPRAAPDVPMRMAPVYGAALAPTPVPAGASGAMHAPAIQEAPLTDRQPATRSTPTTTGSSAGVWIVLPTYNEIGNLPSISTAILGALPEATLLVVDDNSPDGTGRLADELAAADARILVRHRAAKEGLGPAYLDGFRVALAGGASIVIQMDADGSHDPAALPRLVSPVLDGDADLVIGSRYTAGGRVEDWSLGRRVISRGGSLFSQIVLGLRQHDLTGGFKAWRASTLGAIPFDGIHAGGYVFQIEMTYRASRNRARIREVPITFRDRRVGQSKMGRGIVVEALMVVVQLRLGTLRADASGARPAAPRSDPPTG